MFMAASPTAASPAAQTVTGTVTGTVNGTLFIVIDALSGSNVVSLSGVTVSGNVGTATVTPAAPNALGAGTFSSMLRVRACTGDATCNSNQLAGSPQLINVSYVITAAAPQPANATRDVVAPRVAVSSVGGRVILRGANLAGTSSVMLRSNSSGTTVQASNVTQVSATEVRASYPALATGTYSVVLNAGAVPFTGTLVAMPAANPAPTTLKFDPAPSRISTLIYDAERARLLVATAATTPSNNTLVAFSDPNLRTRSVVPLANVRDLAFSADGLRLLAITDTEVLELDAGQLTVTGRVTAPTLSGGARLQRIAVANDGKAIISTGGLNVTAATPALLYDTVTRTFDPTPLAMLNTSGEVEVPGLVASADGSHIYITQSTSAQPILDYSASTGTLSRSAIMFQHMRDQALAVDQSGQRLVPYRIGTIPVVVRDGGFNQVGTFGNLVNPIAIALNRQGTRAYVLDNNGMLFPFGLQAGVPTDTVFGLSDNTIINPNPAGNTGTSVKSAVSHDGATVFMAGVVLGVVVTSGLK